MQAQTTTGQAMVTFVVIRSNAANASDDGHTIAQTLRAHVAQEIGAIAKPRTILEASELPKTRSGKIMRRLLREVP